MGERGCDQRHECVMNADCSNDNLIFNKDTEAAVVEGLNSVIVSAAQRDDSSTQHCEYS